MELSEIMMNIFKVSKVMIHGRKRVTSKHNERRRGKVPFELVELGDEGIGEDEVVVNELTIRATRAIRDAPADGFEGAGENLGNAMAVLEADFVGMAIIAEATGLDDGEKAPTDLGFFGLGEFDRNEAGRKGTVEQGPEAFTDAGGIDYDMLGMPGLGKAFKLAKNGQVIFTDPTVTGDDMVGGMVEDWEGGEVDPNNGEGGGIAAGIAKAGGRNARETPACALVHAGDVEEEGVWWPHPHAGGFPHPLSQSFPFGDTIGFGEGRDE